MEFIAGSAAGTTGFDDRFSFAHSSKGEARWQTSRGRRQDRARVAGGEDHEVKYEATKKSVSKDAVKKAVKDAGNSRKEVEAELAGTD